METILNSTKHQLLKNETHTLSWDMLEICYWVEWSVVWQYKQACWIVLWQIFFYKLLISFIVILGVRCYDDSDGSYRCGPCPAGYTGNGHHCTQIPDPCNPSPCYPGVQCLPGEVIFAYNCLNLAYSVSKEMRRLDSRCFSWKCKLFYWGLFPKGISRELTLPSETGFHREA